jgi:hypothetical protein
MQVKHYRQYRSFVDTVRLENEGPDAALERDGEVCTCHAWNSMGGMLQFLEECAKFFDGRLGRELIGQSLVQGIEVRSHDR